MWETTCNSIPQNPFRISRTVLSSPAVKVVGAEKRFFKILFRSVDISRLVKFAADAAAAVVCCRRARALVSFFLFNLLYACHFPV